MLRPRKLLTAVSAALCLSAGTALALEEELQDLAGQLQFAAYAADARALSRDVRAVEQLEVSESSQPLRAYYLSFGNLKLAEVLRERERGDARRAASKCAEVAGEASNIEAKRGSSTAEKNRVERLKAELWALQAACSGLDAELSLLPGSTFVSLASFRANSAGEKALTAAPNNPRVKLLASIQDARRANSAQERSQAAEKLRETVAIFDATPPSVSDMPDWGAAEALAWLGHVLLARGDKVAARDALERALVLAPDYVWVHTLLKQTSGG